MHCPKCGTVASENQKFCRSCGFGLEKVAELISETAGEQSGELPATWRMIERLRNLIFFGFVTILVGGISYGLIQKIMIEKGHFWQGLLFLLVIYGGIAAVILSIAIDEKRTAHRKRDAMPSAELPLAETTNKLSLDAPHDPVLSVTEGTTRSLESLAAEEKRRGE